MTQVTGKTPEKTIEVLPPAILDGILAGHIAHNIANVKIGKATSPTGKDEVREFDELSALDAEGMAILCGGKIEPQTPTPAEGKDERTPEQKRLGACDHFNYGRDLSVRQKVRAALESALEGPEKTIDKLVKQNMAGGMFDTEAETRDFVVAQLKKRGALPEGYVYGKGATTEAAAPTA